MATPSPAQITAFHRALHRWYKMQGRCDLPWRNTHDSYAIYLSEIMLQQTQVKTVRDRFYAPFLEKFPTLASLARADKQAVIKQWEGLGYYTRAANLHVSAKACGGMLPETAEELRMLPGIGRNTANAIACFAFGQAVPVMEANVRRVLCRVFAIKKVRDDELWEKAELLLDKKNPFDYNQAIMDIGALVCKKREPGCNLCPLQDICRGKSTPALYPAPKTAKSTPVRHRVIAALRDAGGGYYLRRRETRFLHGLYGFPEYPPDRAFITHKKKRYPLGDASIIGQVTQTYSHFTLQAVVHLVNVVADMKNISGLHRATLAEMRDLPLSRVDHKVLAILRQGASEDSPPSLALTPSKGVERVNPVVFKDC